MLHAPEDALAGKPAFDRAPDVEIGVARDAPHRGDVQVDEARRVLDLATAIGEIFRRQRVGRLAGAMPRRKIGKKPVAAREIMRLAAARRDVRMNARREGVEDPRERQGRHADAPRSRGHRVAPRVVGKVGHLHDMNVGVAGRRRVAGTHRAITGAEREGEIGAIAIKPSQRIVDELHLAIAGKEDAVRA